MFNPLVGNAFTRNIWFDIDPRSLKALPSTSCALCTCIVWSCYDQWLRRCIYKTIFFFTLNQGQGGEGHTKFCPVPLSSCDLYTSIVLCSYNPHLRRRCIYKRVNYLKCCPMPSTSCDLCTYRVWSCYVKRFRRRYINKKIFYLTLRRGSMSTNMLPSALYIMWPI